MSSSKKKDEGKSLLHTDNDQRAKTPSTFTQTHYPSMPDKNLPFEPFLFYIRDHELYYTALSGPRYNEYAIFIDYHEWELSATCSFYQYLKIIKAEGRAG